MKHAQEYTKHYNNNETCIEIHKQYNNNETCIEIH